MLNLCEQAGAWYIAGRCGNVLLSSIGVSIVVIVAAQYMLNVMFVLRPFFFATDLSQSPPAPDGLLVTATSSAVAATQPVLHNHSASSSFAQLPSIIRHRVLEYFKPGILPAPTERPKPLCPLPGICTRFAKHWCIHSNI